MNRTVYLLLACVLMPGASLFADDVATPANDNGTSWLAMADDMPAVDATDDKADAPETHQDTQKAGSPPPLPFHSLEGYSGGAITPMAYICNCDTSMTCPVGKPSVAYTFLSLGNKKLNAFSVSETFLGRFEFSYGFQHLFVGNLKDAVSKAGLDLGRNDVWLHTWSLRANLIQENEFDLPLPAVTVGVHAKYNEGISQMDRSLGGALKTINYDGNCGVDYTLTATKMFPELAFGRPIILTGGMRITNAAQTGLLGFGESYKAFFEGSVVYLPFDNIALAYEYRQKESPYDKIEGLIGEEDDWHVFSASWIVNDNITITGVYGMLGMIANGRVDDAFGIQLKYEF